MDIPTSKKGISLCGSFGLWTQRSEVGSVVPTSSTANLDGCGTFPMGSVLRTWLSTWLKDTGHQYPSLLAGFHSLHLLLPHAWKFPLSVTRGDEALSA